MPDRKTAQAAIEQNASIFRDNERIVGLSVKGTGDDARIAVHVDSDNPENDPAVGSIPTTVPVQRGKRTESVDVEVILQGSAFRSE